jgi:hypothetical protein
MRVERPPLLWDPETDLEPFIRLLGEMIAAGLMRNGNVLSELTLNVANVTVEETDDSGSLEAGASGSVPHGDFVAITVRGGGDWLPETTWSPQAVPPSSLVTPHIGAQSSRSGRPKRSKTASYRPGSAGCSGQRA